MNWSTKRFLTGGGTTSVIGCPPYVASETCSLAGTKGRLVSLQDAVLEDIRRLEPQQAKHSIWYFHLLLERNVSRDILSHHDGTIRTPTLISTAITTWTFQIHSPSPETSPIRAGMRCNPLSGRAVPFVGHNNW